MILPGGGFLANIYTPWMGYYGGLRFVPRSFPPGIAFRRFSFRLSKVADFLSISFAREKLFPGNFASEKLRGRFLRETFPRQLRDRFFFEEFLCRLNVMPHSLPGKNFSRKYFFPANVAETFFSKTFFGNFPQIFFPQKNFSRKTSRLKLFPG